MSTEKSMQKSCQKFIKIENKFDKIDKKSVAILFKACKYVNVRRMKTLPDLKSRGFSRTLKNRNRAEIGSGDTPDRRIKAKKLWKSKRVVRKVNRHVPGSYQKPCGVKASQVWKPKKSPPYYDNGAGEVFESFESLEKISRSGTRAERG